LRPKGLCRVFICLRKNAIMAYAHRSRLSSEIREFRCVPKRAITVFWLRWVFVAVARRQLEPARRLFSHGEEVIGTGPMTFLCLPAGKVPAAMRVRTFRRRIAHNNRQPPGKSLAKLTPNGIGLSGLAPGIASFPALSVERFRPGLR
jgi:hypothetical protein